jgi:hypothetical protein
MGQLLKEVTVDAPLGFKITKHGALRHRLITAFVELSRLICHPKANECLSWTITTKSHSPCVHVGWRRLPSNDYMEWARGP